MQRFTFAKLAAIFLFSSTMLGSTALAAALNCTLTSTANWSIPAARGTAATTLRVIVRSTGARCAIAKLSYTILNARGRVLFRQTYQSQSVVPFGEVRTRAQMSAALADWIKPVNRTNFYPNLPDWTAGADSPSAREFGFMPAETITREEYLGIKASRTPVRCYIQGIESINCVIYHGGVIDPFGIQSFPG